MYPNRIILHHSLTKDGQTVNWQAIRKYHTHDLGWSDIGYHFGIEFIKGRWEVLSGRLMTTQGAHTKFYNKGSLGICLVGNFDKLPPPDEQWLLAIKLVRSLMEILYIPRSEVFGHREFADYKSCPGKEFDLEKFRKLL